MEFHNIPYKVSYRNVKHPRLEFKTGELLFVLPFGRKPEVLLEKHKGWILRKLAFIKGCLKDSLDKELEERTDREFKDLLHSFIEKYSKELGVELNKVYFRKMKTKWASCSSRGNLTVNILMRCLPGHLVEYVIFHETAHMIEKRHNDKFWGIVSKGFKNYQEMEKDLFIYWFRVVKNDARCKIHDVFILHPASCILLYQDPPPPPPNPPPLNPPPPNPLLPE